jgi:myo-inositol-1(or 4)-monophosphatase
MSSFAQVASDIAREAGSLLLEFHRRHIPFELKGENDLVTEADRASERLIVERLLAAFPTHGIVAEEGAKHNNSSTFRWFVDPLDGTTNFAHGFPIFNVTMGLAKDEELIAGVIYDPLRDEMFSAERGAGAFLNGERIHVSKVPAVADSLVATGFPSQKRHENINIHFYHQLAMLTHGVRRAGAAATDLAYVACGRLEAFWEFRLKPWDMAAGMLLVSEAGGNVSRMDGSPAPVDSADILADNGHVHEEMLSLFAEVFRGELRHRLPELP